MRQPRISLISSKSSVKIISYFRRKSVRNIWEQFAELCRTLSKLVEGEYKRVMRSCDKITSSEQCSLKDKDAVHVQWSKGGIENSTVRELKEEVELACTKIRLPRKALVRACKWPDDKVVMSKEEEDIESEEELDGYSYEDNEEDKAEEMEEPSLYTYEVPKFLLIECEEEEKARKEQTKKI